MPERAQATPWRVIDRSGYDQERHWSGAPAAMLNYLLFIATIGSIYGAAGAQPQPDLGRGGHGQSRPRRLLRRRRLCLGAADHAGHAPIAARLGAGAGRRAVRPGWSSRSSTTRLREDYLAIVTLGFAEVVRLVASNEIWLTRGTDGISGIPGPWSAALGRELQRRLPADPAGRRCWSVFLLMRRIDRSPYGRALRAIREDAQVAQVAGKPVLRFKTAGLRAVGRHRGPRRRALRPFHVVHRARPLPAADHGLHLPGRRLGRHGPAGRRAGRRLSGDDAARIARFFVEMDPGRHGRATRRAQGTADRRRPDPGAAADALGPAARTHPARTASVLEENP